jgi:hypothetical protein
MCLQLIGNITTHYNMHLGMLPLQLLLFLKSFSIKFLGLDVAL